LNKDWEKRGFDRDKKGMLSLSCSIGGGGYILDKKRDPWRGRVCQEEERSKGFHLSKGRPATRKGSPLRGTFCGPPGGKKRETGERYWEKGKCWEERCK